MKAIIIFCYSLLVFNLALCAYWIYEWTQTGITLYGWLLLANVISILCLIDAIKRTRNQAND